MIPPLASHLLTYEIERVLNEDLSKLSAWAKRWLIKFNAQKTDIMLISNTMIIISNL